MAWFMYGRIEGFPTQYAPNKTAVTVDVLEAGLILAFVILASAYVIVTPGFNRKKRIYTIIKIFFSVLIGCLLMLENFGQEWEVGGIETNTSYRAGTTDELKNAHIGLKFGLRSVNVTLTGKGSENSTLERETINYNERFSWTWDQGRFGFGAYAGLLQRSFRAAQRKGLPLPIIWVVDYLTIDGEGLRFGRFYRTAGWYTHILLWTAFPTWILANIFLLSGGRYTAYFLMLTGGLQLLACIVWSVVRNPNPLVIPFENGNITTTFGANFWMAIICGILCLLLASVLLYMDLRHPGGLSDFLGIDPLNEYDEYLLKSSQYEKLKSAMPQTDNTMEMEMVSSNPSQDTDNTMRTIMIRRSTINRAQKGLYRNPMQITVETYDMVNNDVTNAGENDDEPVYENQSFAGCSTGEFQQSTENIFPPPVPVKKKKLKV